MKRALELAKLGWGKTNPNPLVGAVIVKGGRIISEGYHKALGSDHAEVSAFKNATESITGSTLYVTLEPCSHFGRTPPCANTIIEAGIKEVVVAMVDPNPKVSGRGIKILEDAGITVTADVLNDEARKLNEIFIKYITEKRPFVIMKTASTLDGKIASSSGDSKWITGEASRNYVHALRDRVSAVMVGINTVICDNPHLTTRLPDRKGKNPVRIIVDSRGRIPLDSNVITGISPDCKTWLAATSALDKTSESLLIEKGVKIIKADGTNNNVDLDKLMQELYKLEIDSVLLEGGGELNAAALDAGIVDKAMFFIAPKIIGGKAAPTPVGGVGALKMKDALALKDVSVRRFDEDVLIEGYVRRLKMDS